jgi:Zn-dependent protease with chaperone function
VPDPVGCAADALLAIMAWRVGSEVRRRRDVMRALHAAGAPNDGLLVADWERPHAVAIPGSPASGVDGEPGYVMVTSGLLRILEPDERAAVLAHERAHLRYRHHRIATAVALAAAAHPMLRPVVGAVGLLTERAADEDAAATVGDRRLVARVVAKVALASRSAAPGTLAIGGSSLVRRIAALSSPPTAPSRGWTWLAAAMVLIAAGAAVGALGDFVRVALAWWPAV